MENTQRLCPVCGEVLKPKSKYCSSKCYHAVPRSQTAREKQSASTLGKPKSEEMRRKLSASTRGKPKPWALGEGNPNYGNQILSDPEVRERHLQASRERGQAWSDGDRKRHSECMLGSSNKMRGARHTIETRQAISQTKRKQYENGDLKLNNSKISRAEREIAEWFAKSSIAFVAQHHIDGLTYFFDFFLPEHNLLLEYQGDYWHANPAKHPSGSRIKIRRNGETVVDEIWARDAQKKAAAEALGYRVVYVWESDYKRQGIEAVTCHFG